MFSQVFDAVAYVAAAVVAGAYHGGTGGGQGDVLRGQGGYPVFCYFCQVGGDFLRGGGVAAVAADIGQAADVAGVFFAPADDLRVLPRLFSDFFGGHGAVRGCFCFSQ